MARDVAFEYFHVLYRLKDFVGEVRASDDPDEPPADGFQEVCGCLGIYVQVCDSFDLDLRSLRSKN